MTRLGRATSRHHSRPIAYRWRNLARPAAERARSGASSTVSTALPRGTVGARTAQVVLGATCVSAHASDFRCRSKRTTFARDEPFRVMTRLGPRLRLPARSRDVLGSGPVLMNTPVLAPFHPRWSLLAPFGLSGKI